MSASPKKTKPARKLPAKRKAANGYKLPEPIPLGTVLTDMNKRSWKIGPSIGIGGFGEIYSARDESSNSSEYSFVVKIEPHENGPLFVEMHFYMKVAKPKDIAEWTKQKKLKCLGLPMYIGSGSHMYNNQKYRFLVMERYGKDLWSLFLENNRTFPIATVLAIGLQIVDVLEYIHEKSYIHGDIKGSNILLSLKKGLEDQVYLVDFGLATRYSSTEYKLDPKRAHNGTIEYESRDAHVGVPTRRGDLEVLGFNMIQWAASELPWEKKISEPPEVIQKEKIKYMNDVSTLMKACFKKGSPPQPLVEYFAYIVKLAPDECPNYDLCRKIFKDGLKKCLGSLQNVKLEFNITSEQKPKKPVRNTKRSAKVVLSSPSSDEDSPKRIAISKRKNNREARNVHDMSDEEMDFSSSDSEANNYVVSKAKSRSGKRNH
ncbi:nucleosomal histone kinase 1 [Schistocerca cancellata]|uniref:nucleosomal histone kinase 1 n=1 Tax=Schistocerca cancellata TaxID=274614 RepID=UPI0021194568|nr:nucleosomal histone kinase 1 [Schistocerca cancellata]